MGDRDEEKLLSYAAALEKNSEHVIAAAILAKAQDRKLTLPPHETFQSFPGKGVQGTIAGEKISIGNLAFIQSLSINRSSAQLPQEKITSQGKTVVYIATDKKIQGLIALSDSIREESFTAVTALQKMGIKVAMLTGDHEITARYVADQLGLDTYFAQVLPGDKAANIQQLQSQ
jgi:Cu2+-exporting ATPase